jgi:hypothetical protein
MYSLGTLWIVRVAYACLGETDLSSCRLPGESVLQVWVGANIPVIHLFTRSLGCAFPATGPSKISTDKFFPQTNHLRIPSCQDAM